KDIDSKYKEVSKYPSTIRDISFIVDSSVSLNSYFEIVREYAGNLIEEVKQLDKYENEKKFGKGKVSYTFRIVYCSPERTLTNDEVNAIQDKIRARTASELHAELR
ncbi:MAG: phenylalanine--tRNA ligase subunit beta, partial [Patescibacteria group bacterium]|nr:phenylalanine--tRNA ligase subunit beta [Patescibacteria group bacterium]